VRTPVRLAVVATGPGAVFAAAVGVGAAVGPVGAPGAHPAAAAPAPGPAVDAGTGYVLDVPEEQPPTGTTTVAFRVLGPDGARVSEYTPGHGEDLHLVAVRADLSGYQHVHPDLGADGTWRTPLTLTPGSCTCTPSRTSTSPRRPARTSASPRPRRRPAPIGCSSTSGTATPCTPPPSRCRPPGRRPTSRPVTGTAAEETRA
jgi:hypothetical protein